ncbi:hypothetical protein [Nocardia brasiliensis]|uniref:hypothetical protein n=1 Tax=Nocardia brasiliensis TaxID=37326 RepID=UPI0024556ACB|nr:hypothetical protein [Nocardia brasiliensis]
MTTLYGPAPGAGHIELLHELLTARGWVVDDLGKPGRTHGVEQFDAEWDEWCYPPSFGGIRMNEVDDVTPTRLRCYFSLSSEGPSYARLILMGAGNYEGCADHRCAEWSARLDEGDELNLDQWASVLDEFESQARAIDPRVLIECRFFGTCGNRD